MVNSMFEHNPLQAIHVDGGQISGMLSDDKAIAIYKGIPFAAPPVGELRWKAPQPVPAWDGIRRCTGFSANGIQAPQAPFLCWSDEFIIDTALGYSEDCLYLNVWTQTKSEDQKRPVLVYIHGGANVSGGASCDIYDGEAIAGKGVVYVSINYRMGILGFLAHPELSAEAPDHSSGNYAILDQIAALHWVRNNIARFGGDPDNVTIAGQSAGSENVHALIISPMAKGLFQKAVAMSLNPIAWKLRTFKEKETEGLDAFGDRTLEQMRAMGTEELLKLNLSADICIDGRVITDQFIDTYKSRIANPVAMMTGMVDGDSALFPVLPFEGGSFLYTTEISKADYEAAVVSKFKSQSEDCLAVYPAAPGNAIEAYNQLNLDGAVALQYYLAKARTLNSDNKTYIYQFSHTMPGPDAADMGAFHTADVPYWLNHYSARRENYWAEADYSLGSRMSSYLANFVKTGDPNGDGLSEWNAYNGDDITYLSLDDQMVLKTLTSEQTKFWQDYYGAVLGL